MEEFLEIRAGKSDSPLIHRNGNYNYDNITRVQQVDPKIIADTNSGLTGKRSSSIYRSSCNEKVVNESLLVAGKDEAAANAKVRRELPSIIWRTFSTTILVYCACVATGIIDISSTTIGKAAGVTLCLTVFSFV